MSARPHTYKVTVTWTGNQGDGTASHAGYSRDHIIEAGAKPRIYGSSDPAFLGDPARWNPEDLLLASIAACHKLWYLGLCAQAGIRVRTYRDEAEATMLEDTGGAGRFVSAVLRPRITIAPGGDAARARALHHDAHACCFIANSVNFPITIQPDIDVA
jgi:organic hydroperoxide reductase OsmC/OhrA